jgi:pimeloyl-ACP methyl ester carboxylesterase
MKAFVLLLLCCFSFASFGQAIAPTSTPAISLKNVKFTSGGTILEGTIFKPQHPYAALVLVHGSGQEIRMVEMASLLARNGIAVLTYDKRGVGKSGGIYAGPEVGTNNIDSANLNLLAMDADAAANTLLGHIPATDLPLGFLGASQAGWIIPLAAKKNRKVDFMVVFSGPVVTTLEQLRFQFYTQGKPNFWDTHTEAEAREHLGNDPDRYQFADTDPRDALESLTIPGLWLFGGKDIQIPVRLCIERLSTLNSQGKPYSFHLFPELGHNTAFSKSQEPLIAAIDWIIAFSQHRNLN